MNLVPVLGSKLLGDIIGDNNSKNFSFEQVKPLGACRQRM